MKKLRSILIFVIFALLISGAASASTELVFTGNPTKTGTDVGDTARWINVGSINGTIINVQLKIITLDAGGSVDFQTIGDDARVLYSPGSVGAQTTIDYEFYDADAGNGFDTPVTIIPEAGFKDIDDTNNETAIFQSSEVASYILENPTDLNVVDNAGTITITSNESGSSESNINIQIQFQPTTKIRAIYQADGSTRWFDFDGDVDLVFNNPDLTQLDTTPPVVPTVASLTTNDETPTLTGTAEAFSTVTIVVGGATFEVVADASGNWTLDTADTPISGTFSPNLNGTNEVAVNSADAAGNSTNDVTTNELIIDAIGPSVEIQNAPTSVNSIAAYPVTFEFSEDVTGFELGDITVGNATASNFVAVDANTYTADITPNATGNISIDVAAGVAEDAATNVNTAATTVTTVFDNTAPSVTIQNAPATANSTSPYTITVEFSEDVTDFAIGDVTVGNATVSSFVAVDGNTYTVVITPTGSGDVTVDVAAGVAQDAAGNDNTAASQAVTIFDNIAPSVEIQNAPASANTTASYTVTFAFSEIVTGFEIGDISVVNATVSNFSGSGSTFTADITPDGNGDITINVAAGVAVDVAANPNTAALQVVTQFDADAPTVEIQNVPAAVSDTVPFTVTFEFSEDVTGFTIDDITVGNGTASNFVAEDGNTYTADITPDGNGDISIDVAAGVAQDVFGNENLVATQVTTVLATDADADGIPDSVECPSGPPFDATCQDSDADGTPDYLDTDSDNDGIPDTVEAGVTPGNPIDTDNDGAADFQDPDSDNDGIPDSVEAGSNPATPVDSDTDGTSDYLDLDSDNDGIPDVTEDDVAIGTDTDADGIDDGYDVDQTNGIDADSDGVDDAVGATDTDNDGHPDYQDLDSDSDGISDELESGYDAAAVIFTQDADGDGVPDAMDADTTAGADVDNNGILDNLEPVNTDGDTQGIADFRDLDSDNDSLPDVTEADLTDADGDGLVDGADADGDGIVDSGDATVLPDTDSDGLPDYQDIESTNPTNDGSGPFDIANNPIATGDDANNDGVVDDTTDTDNDGLVDVVDLAPLVFGSTPPYPDADFDGIPDDQEGQGDTDGDGIADAQDTDSDNDGVPDTQEAGIDPTNPLDSDNDGTPDYIDFDSDNDGLPDALEAGPNPLVPLDSDGDGKPDLLDVDSDNDSIPDAVENTGNSGVDSDDDGIDDSYDADATGGADIDGDGVDDEAAATDTDGDLIPNYLDLDSDNDSILDIVEDDVALGSDTDLDGIDDGYDVDEVGGTDSNNDGITDNLDATDTDEDSFPDFLDLDSDADGIPDEIEAGYDASAVDFTQDADGDGVPNDMDTGLVVGDDADNNGIIDSLQPVNTDNDPLGIADYRDLDSDNDSLLDTTEAGLTDADEDGKVDGEDTNGDGIVDTGAATVPVLDSDTDGLPDYTDLESSNPVNDGTGPFDVTSNPDAVGLDTDNDGVIDGTADLDMDGILDVVDPAPNFFGASGDSDNDGVSDTEEIGPDPLNPVDTDNDGTADYLDTDSDNDGFPDALEEVGCPLTANPGDCNSDGIPDRLQADQLETAVTGVGSFGIWSLLMLLPLLFFRLRHNLTSVLPAMAMLLVSAIAFTAKPVLAHDEFYAGREVIKHEFNRFMRYKQESHGDRDKLIDDNKLFFYPGWYAGGGLGTTNVDPEGSSNGFETGDNSSSGFKIYFGRHFRTHWAWEVSYADLGKAELQNPTRPALFDLVSAESGTPEIDYRVPAGWIIYHVMEPNDEFNVYAKAGVSFIDNNANDERIGFEKLTGAQLALGLGAQWRFSDRFFARLELDSYDRDANYAGLSIGMFFGGHEEHTLVMSKKAPVEPASSSAASDSTGQPTVILDDEICNAFATAVDGISFKTNSAELTGSAKDVLKALGISLTAYPDVNIEIQAHTDSDGAAEYNQALSEKRAQSVMDYMIELGVAAERMNANGYGESQPVADNTTREGKASNRRVEFVPVGANCN